MIACRPLCMSWQKTTCSCPALTATPVPFWGVANTFATVVILLVRSALWLARDPDQDYSARAAAHVRCGPPTRGPLVTMSLSAVRASGDQDVSRFRRAALCRIPSHL